MSAFVQTAPHRWAFRPPIATPLNRKSSLTRGLVAAALPPTGGNFADALGNQWTANGGPLPYAPGLTGGSIAITARTASLSSPVVLPAGAFTFLGVCYAEPAGVQVFYGGGGNLSGSNETYTAIAGGGFYIDVSGANIVSNYAPPSPYNLGWHRYGIRIISTGVDIWIDGNHLYTNSTASSPPAMNGVVFGNVDVSGTGEAFTGRYESCFLYNRALTSQEILAWSANPYSMFAAPVDRTWAMVQAPSIAAVAPTHLPGRPTFKWMPKMYRTRMGR